MLPVTAVIFSFNHHQNLLPYCLNSTYQHLPSVKDIVLVWDDFVREREIDFDLLRKQTAVPFRVVYQSQFREWPDSISQWGWIKQQLAKLQCHEFTDTQYNFIIDGDVLITGDVSLFDQEEPVLRHDPVVPVSEGYKFFGTRYLGMQKWHHRTFVGSTALMDRHISEKLAELCQHHCGMNLVDAVDHMLLNKQHPALPFSEFEYYGHLAWIEGNSPVAGNWNYVPYQRKWHEPIQIMWANNNDIDLDKRYQKLMSKQDPQC